MTEPDLRRAYETVGRALDHATYVDPLLWDRLPAAVRRALVDAQNLDAPIDLIPTGKAAS